MSFYKTFFNAPMRHSLKKVEKHHHGLAMLNTNQLNKTDLSAVKKYLYFVASQL